MEFNFTKEQLAKIIGKNQYLDYWYDAIIKILPIYKITTPARVAAFLAQCAHESGNFTRLTENLNYRADSLRKVFPKYFPTDTIAAQYAKRPELIANRVYANRMGNGSEQTGDGWKYRGRGLIQLTGKRNYMLFAASINTPLDQVPDYLVTFEGAIQSACWFWEQNNLNPIADRRDIVQLTKKINGGTIGLADRQRHYQHALHILGG